MQESYTAGFNYFVPISVKDKLLGDVDGDGMITVMDATAIQYYLAGMIISYKIGESIE